MTLFLNGGGCAEQVKDGYRFFKEKIDTTKPLLYIPLAMEKERYPACLEWIKKELSEFHFPKIDIIFSAEELASKNLNEYAAVFIGGGNTYKLLSELKSCSAYQKIQDFLSGDGVVFGGSAGAVIFGKDLISCRHDDSNKVNLRDTAGFNQVFGAYIGVHYPNDNPEKTQKAAEAFTKLSFETAVIALPEEDTLVIGKNEVRVIGSKTFHIFKKGSCYSKNADAIYSTDEFKEELQ